MTHAPLTLVATLGPATRDVAAVTALLNAGADLARVNGAHVRPGQLQALLDLAAEGGFPPDRVVLDLQGAKTRLGWLTPQVEVQRGQRLTLVPSEVQAGQNPEILPVDRPTFLRGLVPGDRLRVDDGRLDLTVLAVHGNRVAVEADGTGALGPRRGLARFGGSAEAEVHLLASDRALLDKALARGVQTLAVSCVSDPELLRLVRRHVRRAAPDLAVRVCAKIEQPAAIERWTSLAVEADALWFCRGDLGAEIGPEQVPAAQRGLLAAALPEAPLLVAGQVLHHMTLAPAPTRSEICHAADLIRAGVAGFVLSDETALGPHGPAALAWLRRIEAAERG